MEQRGPNWIVFHPARPGKPEAIPPIPPRPEKIVATLPDEASAKAALRSENGKNMKVFLFRASKLAGS